MKTMATLLTLLLTPSLFSSELNRAIEEAARLHGVKREYLRAIAMVESSGRTNPPDRINKNGTIDRGMFQINSINWHKCIPLNLRNPGGSARCAARLIRKIKPKNLYDLAKYHSKTPKYRERYADKLRRALYAGN